MVAHLETGYSIKDIMEKQKFIDFCKDIIESKKFHHLEFGYYPLETTLKNGEVEGEYLLIIDDYFCLIESSYFYFNNDLVHFDLNAIYFESIDSSLYRIEKNFLVLNDDIHIPLSEKQIENFMQYKVDYRNKIKESKVFKDIIYKLKDKVKKHFSILGFVNHVEDDHSILPLQCFIVLIDSEYWVINPYFEISLSNKAGLKIDMDRYPLNLLEDEIKKGNKIIEIKNFNQNITNGKFHLTFEQIQIIDGHSEKIQRLYESEEDEKKRVQSKKLMELKKIERLYEQEMEEKERVQSERFKELNKIDSIIKEHAWLLSKKSPTKELFTNFIIKYTNNYFSDFRNHIYSIHQEFNSDSNQLYGNINKLATLCKKRGYFDKTILEQNHNFVILYGLQYASIEYNAKLFLSKYNEFVNGIEKLPIKEIISKFSGITILGDRNKELNTLINYLIYNQKISYDIKLLEYLKDIKRVFTEIQEIKELSLFESSLLSTSDTKEMSMDNLDKMDGIEFEIFIAELFKKMGYQASFTKNSNDQGIDVIVSNAIESLGIQTKRYSVDNSVSNKAIQEVSAGLNFYKLQKGMVITTSYFTQSAKTLAEANNIILWDRIDLDKQIKLYF